MARGTDKIPAAKSEAKHKYFIVVNIQRSTNARQISQNYHY